jgi:hypothetical protein
MVMTSLPALPGAQHDLVADLRGAGRLVIEATAGVTGLVEAMHATISGLGGCLPGASTETTRGITGLVYRCIGGVTGLVGSGLELALHPRAGLTAVRASAPGREAALAILNGVLGDHLEATGNPLAIPMGLRRHGSPVALTTAGIRAAIPHPTRRILIQAHGLCMSDLHWVRDGHDQYAALGHTLGYTVMHLHYNTGRSIAANGRAFSALLESMLEQWPMPVEEISIVAHSMGGLIARSAHHHAAGLGHAWPARLGKLVFLGTPHHGSPLERAGNRLDQALGLSPYTLPFTRLGRVRSAGITDLRHGSLLDEDWGGADRYACEPPVCRTPVPLPRGVECFAVAAVRGSREDTAPARLVGDGLVPLTSALGEHIDPRFALDFPETARWIGRGMGHLALLSRPEVCAQVGRWLDS